MGRPAIPGGSMRAIAARCRRLPARGRIALLGGDALDEAHQLHVEERDAQLEARGHRHLVVADQEPVGQEHARVEVERLLEQAAAGHVAEDVAGRGEPLGLGLGVARRAGSSARRTGASVISTRRSEALRVPAAREHVGGAAGAAARGSARASAPAGAAAAAGTSLNSPRQRGGLVAPVAAVRLVGPLAGEHDLHLRGREARELQQRRRARDAAGLLEPRQAAAQLGEEVALAPSRSSWWSVPIRRALSAASARSSITSPWPGKPIVKVVGGAGARSGHRRHDGRASRRRRTGTRRRGRRTSSGARPRP